MDDALGRNISGGSHNDDEEPSTRSDHVKVSGWGAAFEAWGPHLNNTIVLILLLFLVAYSVIHERQSTNIAREVTQTAASEVAQTRSRVDQHDRDDDERFRKLEARTQLGDDCLQHMLDHARLQIQPRQQKDR